MTKIISHGNVVITIEVDEITHYTVVGYAKKHGISLKGCYTASLGKKAKQLSTLKGYDVSSVPDPKYGKIGTYHEDILSEVFSEQLSRS